MSIYEICPGHPLQAIRGVIRTGSWGCCTKVGVFNPWGGCKNSLVIRMANTNVSTEWSESHWPVSTSDEDGRRRARWRRVLRRRHQCWMRDAGVRQSWMHGSKNSGRAQPWQLVIRRVRRSKCHAIPASARPLQYTHNQVWLTNRSYIHYHRALWASTDNCGIHRP